MSRARPSRTARSTTRRSVFSSTLVQGGHLRGGALLDDSVRDVEGVARTPSPSASRCRGRALVAAPRSHAGLGVFYDRGKVAVRVGGGQDDRVEGRRDPPRWYRRSSGRATTGSRSASSARTTQRASSRSTSTRIRTTDRGRADRRRRPSAAFKGSRGPRPSSGSAASRRRPRSGTSRSRTSACAGSEAEIDDRRNRRPAAQGGFTFIEVLVVMGIIAVLAGLSAVVLLIIAPQARVRDRDARRAR